MVHNVEDYKIEKFSNESIKKDKLIDSSSKNKKSILNSKIITDLNNNKDILLPLLVALAYGVKAYTDYKEKKFSKIPNNKFSRMSVCRIFFKSYKIIYIP